MATYQTTEDELVGLQSADAFEVRAVRIQRSIFKIHSTRMGRLITLVTAVVSYTNNTALLKDVFAVNCQSNLKYQKVMLGRSELHFKRRG